MSVRLEIRIPKEEKEKLEKLAQVFGINVSELMRNYIAKFATIEKTLEALETVKKLEKKLVDAIILSKPFQELLEKLSKYVRLCENWVGFHESKLVQYKAIKGDVCLDWYVRKGEKGYVLERIVWVEVCNEYGTCWYDEYNPSYRRIERLSEVKEFLEDVEFSFEKMLEEKIEEIKSIIK